MLPTHVGRVRAVIDAWVAEHGAPHARGDGPELNIRVTSLDTCSPRTWGWSAGSARPPEGAAVLPTHVGMVRPFSG